MRTVLLLVSSLLASTAVAKPGDPLRVAVLEFTNAAQSSADLDALGKGLQSMITTDLAQVQAFKLVERQRLKDVQDELKLARSADVDKATAAKIGKLAGATHLLSGAYTVVGEKMRIDCRLFGVATGEVLLAEKIEGEKAAFFELEKDLVKKVVGASGTTLQPKERADLSRIHTADFEAFRQFSLGVQAFDDKKYDAALAALHAAESRDKDFKLAHVTLGEYEELIAKLRTQADEILSARDQLERLEKQKARSVQAQLAQRLFTIAEKKGAAAQQERLTALHTLILGYSKAFGVPRAQFYDLENFEDRFALDRTADGLTRSYFAEATALWPKLPVLPSKEFWHAPKSLADFDKELKVAVHELWQRGADYPINRKHYLLDNLRFELHEAALRLHLDQREEAKLAARLYELGLKLEPEDYWKTEQITNLAKVWRSVLELDRSTQIYTAMSSGEKNPWKLKGLASEIETNKRIAAVLQKADKDKAALVREYLLSGPDAWRTAEKWVAQPGPLPPRALYLIGRTREFPRREEYMLVGPHPVWALQMAYWLGTGARVDKMRANEIFYYRIGKARSEEPTDALTIVDGLPRKDLVARFKLSYKPPSDWWPAGAQPGEGGQMPPVDPSRPQVVFMFGLRDLRCDKQKGDDGKDKLGRPMRGYGVVLLADKVQLVEVLEAKRESFEQKRLAYTVKEERALAVGDGGDVEIAVVGGNVQVKVAGKSASLRAPDDRQGFYGFGWRGDGYAQLGALNIGGKQ